MSKDTAGKTGLTRREFVVTSLAAGFATAVMPVVAQTTVTTSSDGLEVGEVQIPVDGEVTMPAYRAMPAAGDDFPVVLVIEEIFGVHEHIKDVCRRFAKAGYFAVAPELFARFGDVTAMADPQEIMTKVVAKVPDHRVMADLDATVAWVAQTGKGNTGKLGITGFCWGGRVVWLYSAHSSAVKAGVAWYGRLVTKPNALQPKDAVTVAGLLKAPVLGLYGGADTGIPPEDVEKMREALRNAKGKSEIIVYPDAPHGFHADYRPSYRPDAARDGWNKALEWFKRYGVA